MAWTDFVTRYKCSIGNDKDVVKKLYLVNIQIIIYFVNLRNEKFHLTCFYYCFQLTCILKCRNAPVLIILRVLNDFYNQIIKLNLTSISTLDILMKFLVLCCTWSTMIRLNLYMYNQRLQRYPRQCITFVIPQLHDYVYSNYVNITT